MSNQRIIAAFAELKQRLSPAVLRENESNAIFIRNYIQKRGLDLGNADHLQQAVSYLDDKELIEWNVAPRELTAAEIKAKQHAEVAAKLKRQIEADSKAQADNRKPYERKQAQQQANESEVLKQIEHFVNSYSVNGAPGRTDQAKSEAGRRYLATIKINSGGKFNPELTLRCVKAAYFSGDSVTDMKRAVDRELASINGAEQRITIAGNLPRYNY